MLPEVGAERAVHVCLHEVELRSSAPGDWPPNGKIVWAEGAGFFFLRNKWSAASVSLGKKKIYGEGSVAHLFFGVLAL